jgi:hypothetical protein
MREITPPSALKTKQKNVASDEKHLLYSFCRSGIWKQLSSVVRALDLLCSCSQSRCLAQQWVFKIFTDERTASRMAHSHAWRLVLILMEGLLFFSLSTGLSILQYGSRFSPKQVVQEKTVNESVGFFWCSLRRIYFHFFHVVLVTHRPVLMQCGENGRKYEYQETDH